MTLTWRIEAKALNSAEPGPQLCILHGKPTCCSHCVESGALSSSLRAASNFSTQDQLLGKKSLFRCGVASLCSELVHHTSKDSVATATDWPKVSCHRAGLLGVLCLTLGQSTGSALKLLGRFSSNLTVM